LWIKPGGDSILFFVSQETFKPGAGPSPTGFPDRIMVYALDLKTRTLLWEKENLDPGTIAHNGPLIISNNKLYLNTGFKVFCLDAFTGDELWRSAYLSNGCFYSNLVEYKDLIIAQADEIGMYALDKNTGAQVWYNKDTDGTVFETLLHEGIVYCTSSGYSRLYAIRASTGETIWKELSPNRGGSKTSDASFFDADIAIDPVHKVLYTSDKYYIMCIKLPE
jgi:outer membrane protein assembly factor BamB